MEDKISLERNIARELSVIGVPADIRGYLYAIEAIKIAIANKEAVFEIAKNVYEPVAKQFGVTAKQAARAIAHAVEVAWDRGDLDTLQEYFGYTVPVSPGKPTSSEFISIIAERIRLGMEDKNSLSLERKIVRKLHIIGVPADIRGYLYAIEAIKIAIANKDAVFAITKNVYEPVAKQFGVTAKQVSSAITHAVEVGWDRGELDTLQECFSYTISTRLRKPTTSEFIAIVAEKIRLETEDKNVLPQERKIVHKLHMIGIPADLRGYPYAIEALKIAIANKDAVLAITKNVYEPVAKQFGVTAKQVSSAITHAVEVACDRGDLDTLHSYFGYTLSNDLVKPTTSEFIAIVAERIRLEFDD